MQQVRATTKSLTFPPLFIARYSFIELSELGRQWREQICTIFESVPNVGSNPGSLDRESGILPLSYRAAAAAVAVAVVVVVVVVVVVLVVVVVVVVAGSR